MKFVMTGHKGLIGDSLLKRLKDEGHEPVLLVDKRESFRDIIHMDEYKLDEPADVMIHLASFCKINKCIKNPELPFKNNVIGSYKVLEFCRENEIPKIVFTSSSRVLAEEKNYYTASKFYAEEAVKGCSQCYGMDYTIVRPSTVYGPFNDLSKRLIDIFSLNALQGKELQIYGDEDKTLDFTYVDDFVDGFMLAMNETNKEFNISYGEPVRVSDVADLIIDLNGGGKKGFYPREAAQPQQIDLGISAITNLGFEPKVNIYEGVRKTFDWYKENFDEILSSRR